MTKTQFLTIAFQYDLTTAQHKARSFGICQAQIDLWTLSVPLI